MPEAIYRSRTVVPLIDAVVQRYCDAEFVAVDTAVCGEIRKTFLPARLASYKAVSALFMSESASSPWMGKMPTPALVVIVILRSSMV
jgi:hypothetical protein